jgi:hypothetical protein
VTGSHQYQGAGQANTMQQPLVQATKDVIHLFAPLAQQFHHSTKSLSSPLEIFCLSFHQ